MDFWMDLKGPVLASTVRIDGNLVAKDATIAHPAVTPVTAEFKAMGPLSLPILSQIESMEATITKIGLDMGLLRMLSFDPITLESRWVQDVRKADGKAVKEGCRSYLKAALKEIPAINVEPGSAIECNILLNVTRYQLFVGGTEYLLVDKLAQIFRVNGVDYYEDLRSLL